MMADTSPPSNLHRVIQVDSEDQLNAQFEEMILKRCCKDEELLKLLRSYFDHHHKIMAFKDCLHQHLSTNKPLIQDGDGSPLSISHNHDQFFHDLSVVFLHQLLMLEILQSFRDGVAQKLDYAKFWIRVLTVGFPIIAVTAAATAAVILKRNPVNVVAAVPVLLGSITAIGAWPLSCLKKYKNRLKKHHGVSGVMMEGAQINITDLYNLLLPAIRFALQMMLSEKVDSGDAGEMRRKSLAAIFQELEGRADDFCRGIHSATQLTLPSLSVYLQD